MNALCSLTREQIAEALDKASDDREYDTTWRELTLVMADAVLALISQDNSSAVTDIRHRILPREMAPGTTFTGDRLNGHLVAENGEIFRKHGRRFMKLVFGADSELVNDMGELVDADELDPSTIRDVQIPGDAA